MKTLSCFLGSLAIIFLTLLEGCTSYKLQNAEVYGVPNRDPVKITENREPLSFMASPWFSMNKNKPFTAYIEGHSDVNSKGVYVLNPVPGEDYFEEPDNVNRYQFNGHNFTWHLPEAQGGIDLDLALTKHFCVYGGFNYAQFNQRDLLGKRFGIGFFSQSEHSAVRFDVSMRYQDFSYDVEYLKVENYTDQKRVYVIRDSNVDTQSNLDFSLTLHTLDKPVNFFMVFTLGSQDFFSFTPNEATLTELEHSSTYASLGAGLFTNITKDIRMIAGARYTIYNEHGMVSMPDFFIQQDFSIF